MPAADPASGWQAVSASLSLQECFCLHEERTVALDTPISYQGQRFQLLPLAERRSFARLKVMVHEHFDGRLSVFFQDHAVPLRLAPADPIQVRKLAEAPRSTAHKPKPGHPWAYRQRLSQAT